MALQPSMMGYAASACLMIMLGVILVYSASRTSYASKQERISAMKDVNYGKENEMKEIKSGWKPIIVL